VVARLLGCYTAMVDRKPAAAVTRHDGTDEKLLLQVKWQGARSDESMSSRVERKSIRGAADQYTSGRVPARCE
jgi:hypothetical protein